MWVVGVRRTDEALTMHYNEIFEVFLHIRLMYFIREYVKCHSFFFTEFLSSLQLYKLCATVCTGADERKTRMDINTAFISGEEDAVESTFEIRSPKWRSAGLDCLIKLIDARLLKTKKA